jgi:hypothetical protein
VAAVRVPLLNIGGTDTGISRLGAASLAIGNGTAGDYSGSVQLTQLVVNNASSSTGVAASISFIGNGNSSTYIYAENQRINFSTGTNGALSDFCVNYNQVSLKAANTLGWTTGTSADSHVNSPDTGISRLGAASLAIGNGTAGNTTGQITATTFTVAASGAAPTSAGTAGTVGQIIANGGKLYFCSASGAAGSATWNTITLVQIL